MARTRRRSARRNPRSILRRLARRNSWFDNSKGHSKAASLGWTRLRSKKRPTRKNPHAASYLPNPFRFGRSTRRRHSFRRNPIGSLKRMIPNKASLRQYMSLGIGISAGFVAMPVVSKALAMANLGAYDRFAGIGQVILGSLVTGMARRKQIKNIGIMIAGFGVYDLIASNLPAKSNGERWLEPLPRLSGITSSIPGLSASYGVAAYPRSRVAGMTSSYQPQLASSYQAPGMDPTVGLADDLAVTAMGHLPGVDFAD